MQRRFSLNLDWSLFPVVLTLAWPTILEQFMGTAVQYLDTAMVGSLGTQATAAVGSTSTVSWVVTSALASFGVGFLAYISQACGRGEYEKARRAVLQSFFTVLILGSVFTVIILSLSPLIPKWMQVAPEIQPLASRYFFVLYLSTLPRTASMILGTVLRSLGDTRAPMLVGIRMNIVNLVLNYFLIYDSLPITLFGSSFVLPRANMGVLGAAAASSLSYLYGGVALAIRLLRHKEVSPKGLPFRVDWDILSPCLKVAVPNMLQRFAASMGYVVFASMINSLGAIATAAHTIANTVESAFYVPGFGMMSASATLTGNAIGAKDKKRLFSMRRMILFIEVSLMVVSGALLFAFAPSMVSVFSDDPQVIQLGATVLRMVAFSEPFYGASIVLEGMLQGAGETKVPFIFNIAGMWCVRIAGTFLCTQILNYSLVGAWACMIAHNLCLFTAYSLYHRSGKWIPDDLD